MALRKVTRYVVLHCAATPPNLDVGVAEIRNWHRARGYSDIGYHFVIRRNGRIETGRQPESAIGAHVKNHNADTIAVCLVGGVDKRGRPESNYTEAQWTALKRLAGDLARRFNAKILGHRDFPKVAKACPCFDAIAWAKQNGLPAAPRMRPTLAAMLALNRIEREDDDERDDVHPGQDPAAPPWGEENRKPLMTRRSFWRDVTGGTLLSSGILTGFTYGMDWMSLLILLAFLSAWAAFFIWLFRADIFGERR